MLHDTSHFRGSWCKSYCAMLVSGLSTPSIASIVSECPTLMQATEATARSPLIKKNVADSSPRFVAGLKLARSKCPHATKDQWKCSGNVQKVFLQEGPGNTCNRPRKETGATSQLY